MPSPDSGDQRRRRRKRRRRKGEEGTIAILDRLRNEYPDAIGIRQDRDAAVLEGKRRQREAEEQARRERECAAIEEGRAKAGVLASQGSHQAAVALLDQLAA